MNRLEQEVLDELYAHYDDDYDRAVNIIELCREEFEAELRDKAAEEQQKVDAPSTEDMISHILANNMNNTITASANAVASATASIASFANSLNTVHLIVESLCDFGRTLNYACSKCRTFSGSVSCATGIESKDQLSVFTVQSMDKLYIDHMKTDHNLPVGEMINVFREYSSAATNRVLIVQ